MMRASKDVSWERISAADLMQKPCKRAQRVAIKLGLQDNRRALSRAAAQQSQAMSIRCLEKYPELQAKRVARDQAWKVRRARRIDLAWCADLIPSEATIH